MHLIDGKSRCASRLKIYKMFQSSVVLKILQKRLTAQIPILLGYKEVRNMRQNARDIAKILQLITKLAANFSCVFFNWVTNKEKVNTKV